MRTGSWTPVTAFFSGRDRERKLEIMKDSRVGSNGVVWLVFSYLIEMAINCPCQSNHTFTIFILYADYQSLFLSAKYSTLSLCSSRRDGEGFCRIFTKTNPSLDNAYYLITGYIFPLALRHLPRFRNLNQFSLNSYISKHLGGVTGDTYGFVIESSELILVLAAVAVGITL